MGLDDRLTWLLIGCIIGAVLGYTTRFLQDLSRSLQEIKEELDEVDEIVRRQGGERGSLTPDLALKIAVPVVVILTAVAAFQSQIALNRAHDVQTLNSAQSDCTTSLLAQTFKALNIRTQYTSSQTEENVELQTAQAAMIGVLLHKPPYTEERRTQAAQDYFSSLNEFLHVSGTTKKTLDDFPYPTAQDLDRCVQERLQELR